MSIVLTVGATRFFPNFVRALSHAFLVLHRFPRIFLTDMPQFLSVWNHAQHVFPSPARLPVTETVWIDTCAAPPSDRRYTLR